MTPAPFPIIRPIVHGHRDGFALSDHTGAEIDVFPDWEGASAGFYTACAALVLLSEVFAKTRAA